MPFLGAKWEFLMESILIYSMIVPDQMVTVGALNAVVEMVAKCFRNAPWNGGGVYTCGRFDAQVSRDQRMRV